MTGWSCGTGQTTKTDEQMQSKVSTDQGASASTVNEHVHARLLLHHQKNKRKLGLNAGVVCSV